eukprot:TRINITY_DN1927_c0_g1_i7.p1 TRINITY_DN1927_c0_g1~~TRINITY_DN1927_c0_g1_i7.p1  ORF type:complete len:427 (-),score=86.85 TRINITY_DN1927_c0_g1_i7:390-1670(-)
MCIRDRYNKLKDEALKIKDEPLFKGEYYITTASKSSIPLVSDKLIITQYDPWKKLGPDGMYVQNYASNGKYYLGTVTYNKDLGMSEFKACDEEAFKRDNSEFTTDYWESVGYGILGGGCNFSQGIKECFNASCKFLFGENETTAKNVEKDREEHIKGINELREKSPYKRTFDDTSRATEITLNAVDTALAAHGAIEIGRAGVGVAKQGIYNFKTSKIGNVSDDVVKVFKGEKLSVPKESLKIPEIEKIKLEKGNVKIEDINKLSKDKIKKNNSVNEAGNKANVIEGGKQSASEIAQSWQGYGKYPGVDNYKDITLKKGKIIYRGEPNGTEYFTTKSAIERLNRDATMIFEGLQVEKSPIHGYRGNMQGYMVNEDIEAAFGITKANPQFGKGGLPQIFAPNVQELIDKGILVPVDNIPLNKQDGDII